jgi:hypothetical protein
MLFGMADRLSRRDRLVHLWFLEYYSRTGDVVAALQQYDRLLSIEPATSQLLFPVLTKALTIPEIRTGVAGYAQQGRPWVRPFVEAALATAEDPRPLAEMLRLADPTARNPVLRPPTRLLVAQLVIKERYAEARDVARRLLGRDAALVEELSFSPVTVSTAAPPLLWTPTENEGLVTQSEEAGSVRVDVAPGASGMAFYRVLSPAPGRYRFTTLVAPADDMPMPEAWWDAHCLSGRGVGKLATSIAAMTADGRALSTDFAIPAGCTALRLSFVTGMDAGQNATAIRLRDAVLRRVAG